MRPLRLATVVDVGANKGQFSLLARDINPGAKIIAFEPLPAAAATFSSLFAGDPLTRLHAVALGRDSGQARMHVSRRQDCSSLLEIGELQVRHAPGSDAAGQETILCKRLDAMLADGDIAAPALLKIDVQGGELAVLDGCGDRLARFDYVLSEVSFVPLYKGQPTADQIIAHLDGHGFAVAGVTAPWMAADGTCLQADFLFRRRPEAAA
jgi:FkbM family methyltransferase